MTRRRLADRLEALFAQAGAAHHRAFLATDGEDPEWPSWYAAHLNETLNHLLGTRLTVTEIADALLAAEAERASRGGLDEWAQAYTGYFIRRFG